MSPALRAMQPALHPPAVSARARRLADRLSQMVPAAARIQVHAGPGAADWALMSRRLHARAFDAAGQPVPMPRVQAMTCARWIIRTHPEAAWSRPHSFDLRTAHLTVDGGR